MMGEDTIRQAVTRLAADPCRSASSCSDRKRAATPMPGLTLICW